MKNKFEQRSFDASLFLFAGIIIIPDCRKYTVNIFINRKERRYEKGSSIICVFCICVCSDFLSGQASGKEKERRETRAGYNGQDNIYQRKRLRAA